VTVVNWFQHRLGFKPEDALIGLLGTAFMVVYMIGAPVFARLAERRSRWVLVGIGVALWSLASGASGLATGFLMLLLTRCFVGIGEAAYGPVAPAIISDFYPVKIRGQVLACSTWPFRSAARWVTCSAGGSPAPGSVTGARTFLARGPRAGAGRSISS